MRTYFPVFSCLVYASCIGKHNDLQNNEDLNLNFIESNLEKYCICFYYMDLYICRYLKIVKSVFNDLLKFTQQIETLNNDDSKLRYWSSNWLTSFFRKEKRKRIEKKRKKLLEKIENIKDQCCRIRKNMFSLIKTINILDDEKPCDCRKNLSNVSKNLLGFLKGQEKLWNECYYFLLDSILNKEEDLTEVLQQINAIYTNINFQIAHLKLQKTFDDFKDFFLLNFEYFLKQCFLPKIVKECIITKKKF
ncbi:hypothetical protein EDEG_01165 [Edhazardia aedis USNM 41457]|uniref:Uncharacterized protein n=1 Tax=Edhazardia aedis (strain USNM 41457) TaxID=1003232 RepID=J8ZYB9_EDHAE|nr:hypothetical protein EDEG_01165 [Edhazardia aedis USNM 41457]|eukprot:EJW04638.1 hypothetical protein EDEG_01165 [Edhazardia aedis USNM 41457]